MKFLIEFFYFQAMALGIKLNKVDFDECHSGSFWLTCLFSGLLFMTLYALVIFFFFDELRTRIPRVLSFLFTGVPGYIACYKFVRKEKYKQIKSRYSKYSNVNGYLFFLMFIVASALYMFTATMGKWF